MHPNADLQRGAAPAAAPRARTPLLVLTTFLVELVVIAAVGNSAVTDRLTKHLPGSDLHRGLVESVLTFAWRFSPAGGTDVGHRWLSQVLCVVALVVLGPLLVATVIRGPITFFRAFFGTVFAVVVATLIAGFVRGLVADPRLYGLHGNQLAAAMFGPAGPTAEAFWAGLALGLFTALFVAVMAVATRRTPAAVVDYEPAPDGRSAAPTQWQDRYYGPPQPATAPPWPAPDQTTGGGYGLGEHDQPTQAIRLPPQSPAPSTAPAPFPASAPAPSPASAPAPFPASGPASAPFPPPAPARAQLQSDDQPTSRFPRPPDDEELDPDNR